MGYLEDAHREWHYINADRPWDCPLDCGMAEVQVDEEDWEEE